MNMKKEMMDDIAETLNFLHKHTESKDRSAMVFIRNKELVGGFAAGPPSGIKLIAKALLRDDTLRSIILKEVREEIEQMVIEKLADAIDDMDNISKELEDILKNGGRFNEN